MDYNMFTPLGILSLIVFGIVTSIAILANGFIVLVNSHHWLQTRKMVACDLLLTFLGTFRFLSQLLCLMIQYIYISNPKTYPNDYAYKIISVFWVFFVIMNFLCITSLNVFYCVKVANFAHPLFLWLKSRIDRLVPRMLTVPLLIYMAVYLPSVVSYFATEKCYNLTGNVPEKKCQDKIDDKYLYTLLYPLQISFTAINFSICLIASFLLLFSLWRHTRNLEKSGTGVKDLSTQVHINVIKLQLLSLFLYTLNFAFLLIALINTLKFGNIDRLIADTVLNLCSSVHSVILIMTNPKLKGACARILSVRGGSA